MRDAAADRDAAQPVQQRVGRATHVQDHRQPSVARQLQLRQVEPLLQRAVQPGHEMVQPDLAHRHQARVVAPGVQRSLQPVEVGVVGAVDIERVDAQGVGRAEAMPQFVYLGEIVGLHGRQHPARHASGARALHHRAQVGSELRRVEVTVRIDPHIPMMAQVPPPAAAAARAT